MDVKVVVCLEVLGNLGEIKASHEHLGFDCIYDFIRVHLTLYHDVGCKLHLQRIGLHGGAASLAVEVALRQFSLFLHLAKAK
jgi:hypothetical protein